MKLPVGFSFFDSFTHSLLDRNSINLFLEREENSIITITRIISKAVSKLHD